MSAVAQGWLGPTLLAATAMAGWLYGDWRKRVEERRLRRGVILDIEKALRAEIEAHLHQLRRFDLVEDRDATAARIVKAGEGAGRFVPLLPRERHDTIFQALVGQIHLLSTDTVRPVTLYYNQVVMVAELADTIRSAAYAELPADRRVNVYRDFIAMKLIAMEFATRAVTALSEDIAWREAPRYLFSSSDEAPASSRTG